MALWPKANKRPAPDDFSSKRADFSSKRATERLVSQGLSLTFRSVGQLCEVVAAERGRRIEMMPFALRGTNIDGMLLVTEDADIVVYEQDAPRCHQEHTQLHELSHILCGHLEEPIGVRGDYLREQFPQLQGVGAVKILRRTDYADRLELEAETMASVLGVRLRARSKLDDGDNFGSEELRRISRSLSKPSDLW